VACEEERAPSLLRVAPGKIKLFREKRASAAPQESHSHLQRNFLVNCCCCCCCFAGFLDSIVKLVILETVGEVSGREGLLRVQYAVLSFHKKPPSTTKIDNKATKQVQFDLVGVGVG
jgi:hypothetical protein